MVLYSSIMAEAGVLYINTEPGCDDMDCTALVVIAQAVISRIWSMALLSGGQ